MNKFHFLDESKIQALLYLQVFREYRPLTSKVNLGCPGDETNLCLNRPYLYLSPSSLAISASDMSRTHSINQPKSYSKFTMGIASDVTMTRRCGLKNRSFATGGCCKGLTLIVVLNAKSVLEKCGPLSSKVYLIFNHL